MKICTREWGVVPTLKSYLEMTTVLAVQRLRHRRQLSAGERHAMDSYANKHADAAGQRINRYLYEKWRRSNPQIAGQVALIDSALLSSRLAAPRTLFRGLSGPGVEAITASWIPGSKVTFPSYLSTSFMPLQALLYGVGGCVLKFEIPSGVEIRAAYSPKEDEIMLPRGLTWIVTRVCEGVKVPQRVTVHPIHGPHGRATDNMVRMFVLAPPSRPSILRRLRASHTD